MSDKSEWIWMPHPGHSIISRYCRFFLNTCVGDYIVSTIGECFPPEMARELFAKVQHVNLKKIGHMREIEYLPKVGYQPLDAFGNIYETIVFSAEDSDWSRGRCNCCPKVVYVYEERDIEGYSCFTDAYEGHMRLCDKWSGRLNEENEI